MPEMPPEMDFNPLPRKEGDLCDPAKIRTGDFISIHSLVKRETLLLLFFQIKPSNFNPLPRKEGDLLNVRYVCQTCLFQSTPS